MGLRHRLIDLNRGSFNGLEAAFYELLSAPAVREIVSPVLVDALHDKFPGLVLDVGCGSGALTEDLERAGHQVVGVDPSVPQLLRRRSAIACVAAPAGRLPFPDATFAGVVSSCSVKHWPSLSDGLSECVRVLAPAGVMVVVEIDGGKDGSELVRFAARTRVPPGLRRGYRAMARRSFVPLTPDPHELGDRLTDRGLQVTQGRVQGLPFFVVSARRASSS
jgi:SAM-dependent methyltransferase